MRHMTEQNMEWGKLLGSAAVGALAMYLLDPDRGAPRRAVSGLKLREMGKQTGDALERVVRSIGEGAGHDGRHHAADLAHRAADSGRELAHRASDSGRELAQRATETGRELAQRASETGHDIAARAAEAMHTAETRVRSAMHRATEAAEPLVEASRGPWSGGTRSAAVVGGGALGLYALASRSPLAIVAGLAGLALLARGASNRPLRSLAGRRRAVEVTRSIRIDASPEQVYELWSNYENFPHFMSNVVEVRDLGNRRSHWIVKGPAGSEFQFNSVLTEQSRGRRLSWRSEPGAEIEQSGTVEFQPARGGTRVTVHMSYVPPAGEAGHAIAALLGSDPGQQMDEDLARMKSLIERGVIPSGAARQGGFASRFLH